MKSSAHKTTHADAEASVAKANGTSLSLPVVPVLQQKGQEESVLEFSVQRKNASQFAGSGDDKRQLKPAQLKVNETGMPDQLKSGVESLSGMSMDHVKVHYNSSQPAQLNALAYAQGSDIHIGPGQEKHLPHEAWHVVQQAQGRVQPTRQMKSAVPVNDDPGLEHEADVMGEKAMQMKQSSYQCNTKTDLSGQKNTTTGTLQKVAVEVVKQDPVSSVSDHTSVSQLVTQCVSVEIHKKIPKESLVSEKLLETVINEMKRIVEVAEQAEGKENSGSEHKRLLEILSKSELKEKLPSTSNTTYGLGGSNYFDDTPFTTTQGPLGFGQAVSSIEGIGSTEHLGSRKTGKHDEMHQITHYPGLQALASTQGHCFFCYGTIHERGYEHGTLRDKDPWPQDWEHDYLGFKLKKTSQQAESISHAYDPAIKITSDKNGTRYYFVSVA